MSYKYEIIFRTEYLGSGEEQDSMMKGIATECVLFSEETDAEVCVFDNMSLTTKRDHGDLHFFLSLDIPREDNDEPEL